MNKPNILDFILSVNGNVKEAKSIYTVWFYKALLLRNGQTDKQPSRFTVKS